MVKRDYYIVLGVPRAESPAGIHDAFRRLAKVHHPDSAGPESTERFQEIAQAYATLSDAEQRRAYDQSLRRMENLHRPEPLIPEPMSMRDFQTIRPSFGALFDRIERNFTGFDVPKGERIADLNFEVNLTPDEAARGGIVPISVPVFQPCSLCGGSGRDWLFSCLACAGEGAIEREAAVPVEIPPMVRDRTIVEVPLRGLGIHNFYLRLLIRVSRW
jgi:DnaJ-class molecular chaperone